jgi:diacylglycerol kinase (ATP)
MILFLVNPRARRGGESALPRALAKRFARHEVDVVIDPRPIDVLRRCDALDPGRGDCVVAVGGDGTVNRILNAAVPRGIPIGILPLGRANDFARELRIPSELQRACRVLEDGTRIRVDLLLVNGTYFATCGGTDVAAAVADRINRWMRAWGVRRAARHVGPGLYMAAAVRELLRPIPDQSFRLGLGDSNPEWGALALLVSNQRLFGRRFEASPRASNRDGLMNICVLPRPRGARALAATLGNVLSGRLSEMRNARHLTATHANITASRQVRFFGDGEVLAQGREFRIRVDCGAACVIAPAATEAA